MEIKFRVISGNEIVGEERLTDRGWEWMYYALNPDSGERWNSGTMDIENSSKKITRNLFTGLHDKNGKGRDVYEDDLFEIVFKDCPDGFSIMGRETTVIKLVGRVVFKFGKFMLEFIHPETNELVYTNLFEFLKNEQKEVIGNAYQHKHLLP